MSKVIQRELPRLLPRLRRFAYGLTGAIDSADDLVQGACERALKQNKHWDKEDHIDRWMYRTIRNMHVDQLRHQQVVQRFKENVLDDQPFSEDSETVYEKTILLNEVRAAIETLSEEQKAIMLLICLEGYSYREVSETLGLPIGTVTSRLARGRNQVLKQLDAKQGVTADVKRITNDC